MLKLFVGLLLSLAACAQPFTSQTQGGVTISVAKCCYVVDPSVSGMSLTDVGFLIIVRANSAFDPATAFSVRIVYTTAEGVTEEQSQILERRKFTSHVFTAPACHLVSIAVTELRPDPEVTFSF